MNSLSWLIYIIGAVGNLHVVLTTVLIISIIITFLGTLFITLSIADGLESTNDIPNFVMRIYKSAWFALPIAAVLLTVIPSQRTMILIASSEVGEKVIKSEQVQAVIDPSINLLKKWIEKETQTISKELEEKATK